MRSIRDFTDQEMQEQIASAQELLDILEYGSGDYNAAKAEYEVAVKELSRRENSNHH